MSIHHKPPTLRDDEGRGRVWRFGIGGNGMGPGPPHDAGPGS